MRFKLGDILCVDGEQYRVEGYIVYQNVSDRCNWEEYKLVGVENKTVRWLSIDDTYKEYSIWEVVYHTPDRSGYHESDRGVEVVSACGGSVDVSPGEQANFMEYEDETEELIISEELWSDEREHSTGYYLDEDEFWLVRSDPGYQTRKKLPVILLVLGVFLIPMLSVIGDVVSNIHFTTNIQKYLDKSSSYTYVTSVTGNEKQKAKVYSSPFTIDATAKDIIAAIEGDTEYVQQDDTETEGAVAILTEKEYCVIYTALEGDVYVQISNRKYAYTTDDDLYDGSEEARRYYRRFYHSTGYFSDSERYSGYSSPYSSYDGEAFSYASGNTYDSYSSSIRQSSIASRQSSGGGLSGGK